MAGWLSSKSSPKSSRRDDPHGRRDGRERGGRDHGGRDQANGHHRGIGGSAAVARARQQLLELTNRECESVSSVSRRRDGGWTVALEVVELERIPRTTDILASYVVELDEHGELLRYERVNRYYRNATSGGGEE
jgi:hypothetical protein